MYAVIHLIQIDVIGIINVAVLPFFLRCIVDVLTAAVKSYRHTEPYKRTVSKCIDIQIITEIIFEIDFSVAGKRIVCGIADTAERVEILIEVAVVKAITLFSRAVGLTVKRGMS